MSFATVGGICAYFFHRLPRDRSTEKRRRVWQLENLDDCTTHITGPGPMNRCGPRERTVENADGRFTYASET